ncbi:hypothetical protein EU546_08415 [Candidatus Thorarchaeota archaeon]|jgi:hypothetical protein|nr:MAG: hypothetical protein EU546_08415 [Candidatus Thorarchaeota archaeon]
MDNSTIGMIFAALSLIPLTFLIHTLLHLEQLGIPSTHPRVLVEFSIFVSLLVLSLFLLLS